MRRSSFRIAATLAFAVSVVTCSDSASSPRSLHGNAQIALAPRLSAEAAEILRELRAFAFDVTSVRIVILRAPSTVLKDTTVSFGPNDDEVSVVLEIPLNATQEQLVAQVELRDGTTVLFSGTQTILAKQGQTTESATPVTLSYVGPGANARRLEIQPPAPTILLGGQQQFAAAAFDAGNAPVSGLPVNWSSSNANVVALNGNGLAVTGGTLGTATVTARSANGLVATTTIRVIGPPAGLAFELSDLTGVVGTTVAQPLTVQVLTAQEVAVPGVTVTFSAVTAGGSVTTASAVTDANGRASTTVKLGTAAGVYVFQAKLAAFPNVPAATASVTAAAGPPASIGIVSGNGQTASGALPLPQPLVVDVKDALGNLVPNTTVRWTRVSGTGSFPAATTTTDANGRTSTSYLLGNVGGTETLQADLPGVSGSAVAFTVTVVPSVASLAKIAGDQTGVVGTIVAEPLTVRALTSTGVPVVGVTVAFRAVTSGASVTAGTAITDVDGRASTTLRVGTTVGSYTFEAKLSDYPAVAAVTATVTAVAGAPAIVAIVSGSGQNVNGSLPLPEPLVVVVKDAAGNPVPNATVRWTRVSGNGSFPAATTTTDANGQTSTSYTLQNLSSTETLQADLPNVPNSAVTFTITVVQAVASVTKTVGDNQTGIVDQFLEAPLTVVVRSPSGALASNTAVAFALADTSGWLAYTDFLAKTVNATTDATGTATVRWQLGTVAGSQRVFVTALGITESFTATAIADAASRLLVLQQPPTSIAANVVFTPQPRVQLTDQFLNPVRRAGFTLYAVAECVSACNAIPPVDTATRGTFGTNPVTSDANGVFTFTDLRINMPLGVYRFSFIDASERTGGQTSDFNLVTGPAASIEQSIPETEYTATVRGGGPVDFTPRVLITDAMGYPVAGVQVTWGPAPGASGNQGTIGNTITVTDAAGFASTGVWSLPAAPGPYSIAATVSGGPLAGRQVVFTATSLSVATTLEIVSGDNQSARGFGAALAQPLVVMVRDQAGNPMPGVFVSWQTAGGGAAGSGQFRTSDSFTNAAGTAQATYVFPSDSAARTYRIIATANGAGGPTQNLFAVLVGSGTVKRWRGGTKGAETRWDVASNWETPGGGATSVPSDEEVFIPAVFTWPSPVVSTTGSAGSLYIESSANVTIANGATLTSSGDVMAFGDIRGAGLLRMTGQRRVRGTIAGSLQVSSFVSLAGNLFMGGSVTVDPRMTLQAAPVPGSTGISLHVSGTLNNNGNLTLGDPNALTDPPQMTDVSIRTLNLFSGSVTTIYDSGNTRTVLFDTDILSCHRSPTATINDSRIGPMLGGCSVDLP